MDTKLSEEELASLWQKYKENHEREIRDVIVENYVPLVNIIAGRVAISLPPHIEKDDLISSGFFGLMDAVERYDPSRENKFETYAGVRIRGAMLDYLRSRDWMPVSVRQKIRTYEKTIGELETNLGRAATDEEIAAAMGITQDELVKLLSELNVSTVIPLDDYTKSDLMQNTAPSPAEEIEKKELREALAKGIEILPEREKQLLALYYYEELTMREISLVLHISEARVCQIHTRAILRLRGYLSQTGADIRNN